MNTPLTVKELYDALGEIIAEGYGDKHCYVTTDEEGNDYHPMWFSPTYIAKDVKELMQYSCSGFSNCIDPDNAVMLG